MKSMPRYSKHQELEETPEKPFLEDLSNDLEKIDYHYNQSEARRIKKLMAEKIIQNI